MSNYDFGEEHLKFLFERWKLEQNLSDTEKLANGNMGSAEEWIQKAQWLEDKLNSYIGNLEDWMEGTNKSIQALDDNDK